MSDLISNQINISINPINQVKKSPVEMLLPYQVPHVYQMYESLLTTQCVLDGSDTGTGKTYATLACCNLLKLKPFIICPKSVISSWISVANTIGVEILGLSNYEKLKGSKYYTPNLEIVDCPYLDKVIVSEDKSEPLENIKKSQERIMKLMKEKVNESKIDSKLLKLTKQIKPQRKEIKDYIFQFPNDTIIIVDEAHKCKNYKTGNSTMLLALKDSGRKIVLLSATITDKIECFRPFGVMFGFYDDVKKYKFWIRDKLNPKDTNKTSTNNKNKNIRTILKAKQKLGIPLSVLEQTRLDNLNKQASDDNEILKIIHKSVYPSRGSRMKIKELGDLFPQNQVLAQCYYSDDHCKVDDIYNLINKALEDIKIKEKRSAALGEIIRCRMRLEMLKLPIILDLTDEALETNRSVVIFVNFKDSMAYLQHHLEEECSVIHGDQTLDERTLNIEQFQSNKTKIMIAIIQAGGVGISLHDLHGRPRTSIISPSWNGIDLMQALGRIHRAGSKSASLQRIVYIAKSYEEEICNKLQEKLSVMAAINDGDVVGTKFDTTKLKEIGELDKINNTVTNLDEIKINTERTDNSNDVRNSHQNIKLDLEDEKPKKIKKNKKVINRKKYETIEGSDSEDKHELKPKKQFMDDDDDENLFGKLPNKYKA